jgi:hypothetical protein
MRNHRLSLAASNSLILQSDFHFLIEMLTHGLQVLFTLTAFPLIGDRDLELAISVEQASHDDADDDQNDQHSLIGGEEGVIR